MPDTIYAHTDPNRSPKDWHTLEKHLKDTAERCRHFCERFGPEWGYIAGLLHDFGKYQPAFQKYLVDSANANCKDAGKAPHSAAGALLAIENDLKCIAGPIQSHHGALKARSEVKELKDCEDTQHRLAEAKRLAPQPYVPPPKPEVTQFPALWTRFLFSALVDADSLDTERFFTGVERPRPSVTLDTLLEKLESELTSKQLDSGAESEMNRLRRKVQEYAREAARDELREMRRARLVAARAGRVD